MVIAEVNEGTADRIRLLQLFFVAQVICGHIAMIALPPFVMLTFDEPHDYIIAFWRLTTRFGLQAAYGFIFLSGYFLIPQLYRIVRHKDAAALRHFFLRRLIRIYPVLVAALILTLVLDNIGTAPHQGEAIYRIIPGYNAIEARTLSNFLRNLLSLQPTFSGAFGSNGPLWTLGYIVQFYVVATVMAFIAVRNLVWTYVSILIITTLAFLLKPEWALLFLSWLGGGLVRVVNIGTPKTWPILLVTGIVLFVLSNLAPAMLSILTAAFAVAMMVTALTKVDAKTFLPSFLSRLSDASYPLYAFHFPILILVFVYLGSNITLFTLLGLVLSIFTALLWQHMVER